MNREMESLTAGEVFGGCVLGVGFNSGGKFGSVTASFDCCFIFIIKNHNWKSTHGSTILDL